MPAIASTSELPLFPSFTSLGNVDDLSEQTYSAFARYGFFDFDKNNVEQLTHYMHVYRVDGGKNLIREGDLGDYMVLIIYGRVEVYKNDHMGVEQLMASAGPGTAIGEMSMIDGEPRFATCVAMEATAFAVLTRDNMVKLILDHPSVGAKILIKLAGLLSQRLRQTSSKLLDFMAEQRFEG